MHLFPSFRTASLVLALPVAAACSDRTPATLPVQPLSPPGGAAAALQCAVQVRAGTLECTPRASGAGGPSAVMLGGQGTNVRLRSSGTIYDAGTSIFRSNVTVENLTAQTLGTTDGVTPAPEGVRVFFASGPTVTGGTGTVTIANADGQDVFTAPGQSFFRYDGILFPGDISAAKEWRFSLSPGVLTFVFTIYVAAPVPSEAGWVGVQPIGPSMMVGDTLHLSGTVTGVTGRAVEGAAVAWSTSNPARATVDSLGVVTALDTGRVDITATSGGRTGRVTVVIDPAGALPRRPTIVAFEMLPRSLFSDWSDTLLFRVTMRRFSSSAVQVQIARGGDSGACGATFARHGTGGDDVYECRLLFSPPAVGVWQVTQLTTSGTPGRTLSTAELLAAGAPATANLRTPAAPTDTAAPVLTEIDLVPDTVRAGVDPLEVSMWMADQGAGALRFIAVFRHPQASERYGCTGTLRGGTRFDGLFRCGLFVLPDYARSGAWTIDYVETTDLNGNKRLYRAPELQAAGMQASFVVTNPNPDLTPPDITAFSFTPDTVKATGWIR